MNKVVMFIWGSIIVLLCTLIFLIGYKEKDHELIDYQQSLKNATVLYIKNNNLSNRKQIVFVEDLVKDNYIENDEKVDKYCVNSIVYTKGILMDDFVMNYNCKK